MYTIYVPESTSDFTGVNVASIVPGLIEGDTAGSSVMSYIFTTGRLSASVSCPCQNTLCVIGEFEPTRISI